MITVRPGVFYRVLPKPKCIRRFVSFHSDNQPKERYDAIIIGSGHNGLVAAAYLQKQGINTCILERRQIVGGAAVTEEIVQGFKFSRASYLLSLLRPVIFEELELQKYGLKVHRRNPSSYTPIHEKYWTTNSPRSLTLSNDPQFNREQISQFSTKDAENYEAYEDWLLGLIAAIDPLLDSPPVNISKRTKSLGSLKQTLSQLVPLVKSANILRKNIPEFYELMTSPASKILNKWFESEPLKATLATDSVIGAMVSPHTPGSSYVLLHHMMGEIEGSKGVWAYPEGGMGSVTQAMAHSAVANGAVIYTEQEVEEILAEKGRAIGVRLTNGRTISAKMVLSNATPYVTFQKLLDRNVLPESFNKAMENVDYTSPVTKINVALKTLPNFCANPNSGQNAMPHHQCTCHINCENMEDIDVAYREALQGEIPQKPMIEMVIPSSLDKTIAPKDCHVALLFTQYTPYQLKNQDWTEDTKTSYANRVFSQIEEYAPGFKESIVGYEVLTPPDLERIFGLTGGNIFHGSMRLDQLYWGRPATSNDCDFPATPIENLYLCGSGSHPGGGVMGAPGRNAALLAAQDWKLLKK